MSLNWDVSGVADDAAWTDKNEHGEQFLTPICESLIWMTISVGLPSIEEGNIDKWLDRIYRVAVATNYRGLTKGIDEQVLRRHVGLRTNATKLTDSQFAKELLRRLDHTARTWKWTDLEAYGGGAD